MRALAFVSAVVLVLWWFPKFWYTRGATDSFLWLGERAAVPGWAFTNVPIGKTAEAFLVADRVVNGELLRADGRKVRVYSAKRYLKKENEIGLFSHTPDRCWTAAGMKMEPVDVDHVERTIHGVNLLLERRIFSFGPQRELVYFGAVVGGKPLPYRIDQYQSAAGARRDGQHGDLGGVWQRLTQPRLWSWAWESFRKRTPLAGPQQFIRVSTPIQGNEIAALDALLVEVLGQWLVPADYPQELAQWREAKP